jgi:hypothetical protein
MPFCWITHAPYWGEREGFLRLIEGNIEYRILLEKQVRFLRMTVFLRRMNAGSNFRMRFVPVHNHFLELPGGSKILFNEPNPAAGSRQLHRRSSILPLLSTHCFNIHLALFVS